MEVGHRYRIRIKRDADRKQKTVVMDFMAEHEREYLFSARPVAGTQTIPRRWILGVEEVDKATTPIQLLK